MTGHLGDVEHTLQVALVLLETMGRNRRLLLDAAKSMAWQTVPIPRNTPGLCRQLPIRNQVPTQRQVRRTPQPITGGRALSARKSLPQARQTSVLPEQTRLRNAISTTSQSTC
nr:hypothetical protein [Mycobacterium uberis]